ncbi:hypothetical protein D3C75_1311090 [compost metagenome]
MDQDLRLFPHPTIDIVIGRQNEDEQAIHFADVIHELAEQNLSALVPEAPIHLAL